MGLNRNRIVEEDLKYITGASLDWTVFKDKTVLISGAAGFLPSYLVETLLYLNETKGLNITVIGLVRDLENGKKRFAHCAPESGLRLIEQDVCEPIKIDGPVDFIIHAASLASPKYFEQDPVGTLSPNVIGTANLLKLADEKKSSGFLFFSSTGVYGFVDDSAYPVKEDHFGSLNPTELASCYLESKRMGENMCVAWHKQFGVPAKIVRPAITYGPGIKLDDGRSFADFIANLVNRQDIILLSEGKVKRNYCYIADATLGFFYVLLKGEPGQAYNVTTEQEISVADLADKLVREIFPELKLQVVRKTDQTRDFLRMNFPRSAFDISKLKSLGWKTNFDLARGFRRTVESYQGGDA